MNKHFFSFLFVFFTGVCGAMAPVGMARSSVPSHGVSYPVALLPLAVSDLKERVVTLAQHRSSLFNKAGRAFVDQVIRKPHAEKIAYLARLMRRFPSWALGDLPWVCLKIDTFDRPLVFPRISSSSDGTKLCIFATEFAHGVFIDVLNESTDLLASLDRLVNSVAVSRDGQMVAAALEGKGIDVVLCSPEADAQTQQLRELIRKFPPVFLHNHVLFSPHGNYLASFGGEGNFFLARLHEDAHGSEWQGTLIPMDRAVVNVTFDDNEKCVFIGCHDGHIEVAPLADKQVALEAGKDRVDFGAIGEALLHNRAVTYLACSPDGAWLASADRGPSARLVVSKIEPGADHCEIKPQFVLKKNVCSLAFVPGDSTMLAVGCMKDSIEYVEVFSIDDDRMTAIEGLCAGAHVCALREGPVMACMENNGKTLSYWSPFEVAFAQELAEASAMNKSRRGVAAADQK